MSLLARRRQRETVVVRVSLAPPEPAPPTSVLPEPCVSYVRQLSSSESSPSEAPLGRWLADSAKKAYSAAGHKLADEVQPLCSRRV
jgi:hypothetical protein